MAFLKLFTYNILDQTDSTVTVTGSADSGYPESRLYDRSIDFYWQYTASGDLIIHVDQGASNQLSVDTLFIERHNFNGFVMQWQYSDNDSDWTDAVTDWTQSGNTQIVKTLAAAVTHRYWRVHVASAVNPRCTEVFMSGGYSFQVRFDSLPEEADTDNVIWNETLGGIERSVKLGDIRKGRKYSFFLYPELLTNWRTAIDYLDENSKPFYIKDHEGNYWLARFKALPGGSFPTEQQQYKEVELLELL